MKSSFPSLPSVQPDPESDLQREQNLWGEQPWFILFMATVLALFFVLTLPWWLARRLWRFAADKTFHEPATSPGLRRAVDASAAAHTSTRPAIKTQTPPPAGS